MKTGKMESLIRVAVIGVSGWGQYHLLAIQELEKRKICKLVAIATRTKENAAKFSKIYNVPAYTDYLQLFSKEELDAVTIATPDHLHRDIVLSALDNKLHVFVEKPLDLTIEGCKKIAQKADEAGVILHVDFHKRYDPYVKSLRELIKNDAFGNIEYVYAYMEDRIDIPQKMHWAASTDPYWFLGVHKIDALRWMLDQEVVEVFAKAHKKVLVSHGIDTFDSISFLAEFTRGTVGFVNVGWILPSCFEAPVNQGFRIVGTQGLAEVDTQDRGFKIWNEGRMQTLNLFTLHKVTEGGDEVPRGYYIDSVFDFIYNVYLVKTGAKAVEELKDKYPNERDGLYATQVGVAVHQSILTGRPIKISEVV
ncbi:MAG: Gfo/Idh/MocA family oxidoreductase [Candidatus Bathyarchaeia archaeon]